MFVNSFVENPFQYKREFIILDQILVLENARSKGIGKLLLDEVFSFAKSLVVSKITSPVAKFTFMFFIPCLSRYL